MGFFDKWSNKKKQDQLEAVKGAEPKVQVEKNKKAVSGEKEKKDTAEKIEKKQRTRPISLTGHAHKILVRPIVSEKAAMFESKGIYSFVVSMRANKTAVKEAIREVYGIRPSKVCMINVEGKNARFGRQEGRRNDWKKAIVYLPKGQSIDIHEGV